MRNATPEPTRLPLAMLAEPVPESYWVAVDLPVGRHGQELRVGAFMCPDSGRPGEWTLGSPVGVERGDPAAEWALLTNDEIRDYAESDLACHALLQLGDSGTR